ncbi:MAG: cyclic pyranopterin monophosphate synthase MoaC [bacterium]|nr:cyclic pyranopterin monophosphate synthase MoaC [bacterium]
MKNSRLTHLDKDGKTKMVDVGDKKITSREAVASGTVKVSPEVIKLIVENKIGKGNVLEIAKIAGIMAAKKTKELIPLCHQINLTHIGLELEIDKLNKKINIQSFVKTKDRTGVEMEALTAVAVAGLTIYDMCKAVDKSMEIGEISLLVKKGGKSGTYVRK